MQIFLITVANEYQTKNTKYLPPPSPIFYRPPYGLFVTFKEKQHKDTKRRQFHFMHSNLETHHLFIFPPFVITMSHRFASSLYNDVINSTKKLQTIWHSSWKRWLVRDYVIPLFMMLLHHIVEITFWKLPIVITAVHDRLNNQWNVQGVY